MTKEKHTYYQSEPKEEAIDFNKLRLLILKNWKWLLLIFVILNASAYLFLRWTKPVYESHSEIKLEIESDASEFGYGGFFEEKNLSILSGEIELLKSGLFFDILIDSLDLEVGYYTKGSFLNDEKYPNPPFLIEFISINRNWIDKPVFLKFNDDQTFQLSLDGSFKDFPNDQPVGKEISLDGSKFVLNLVYSLSQLQKDDYFFTYHSRGSLHRYFDVHMDVELLNLKANTLKISIRDNNKFKARDLVNAINKIYIEYTQQEKSLANKKKIEWIDDQLNRIETELDNYENFFEDFTIKNRTADLDEDLRRTIEQINQIDSNRMALDLRKDLLEKARNELNSNKIVAPSRYFPPELTRVIGEFNDLLLQKEQLGLTYKETTFAMRDLDKKIESGEENMEAMLNSMISSIDNQLSQLTSQRMDLEKNFTQIPGKSTELNKNQRYYDLYEEFYLSLMQSKAEFEIAVAGTTPNFKVLASATSPDEPIYPNTILIYSISIMASFVLGIFMITILYITEDKVNSIEDISRILPYSNLGHVPKSKIKTDNNRIIVHKYPKSGVSEALRSIRTNIQFMVPNKKSQVLTVTSNTGGEGKTFISLNLGAIYAGSNKKVLLIDLDMRKPQIHSTFNIKDAKDKGVSTVLINKHKASDCIVNTGIENLFVLSSGPIPPNPSELILNGEFDNLLNQLKKEFDIIILDTPPVGLVTDGILAMKRSDLTLLVIRSAYSRKKDINSIRRFTNFNDSNIAVILNNVERSSIYGYNYGYYSEKS